MKKVKILELILILYIILFLYTGISKLIDYHIFKEQIADSPLLSPIAKQIASSLPWVEFSLIILLIAPRWRLTGLYGSLVLMTLFIIYIIGILIFNKHLPCSCGGILAELSWTQHIIFNSIYIILAIVGIILHKQIQQGRSSELPPIKPLRFDA